MFTRLIVPDLPSNWNFSGSLDYVGTPSGNMGRGSFSRTIGKYYIELKLTNAVNFSCNIGFADSVASTSAELGTSDTGFGAQYRLDAGSASFKTSPTVTTSGTPPNNLVLNDIVGCAFDMDTLQAWFHRNGTWVGGGSPSAGTGANVSAISSGITWFPAASGTNATTLTIQRVLVYLPDGFSEW